MTKAKSTKRALLMSALSLLLCVSMLVGSTFAWFTDSVTSAGNIIKSGNLDVEMYWADGTQAVPTTDAGWTDASAGAIFAYTLWEPGFTQVRHLKIANEGSLALKYQLFITADGAVSDLTDVIDVYYTDPATQVVDRTYLTEESYLCNLTDALENLGNTASGNLPAGESHTVTLALKMQETAGNEYQNKDVGSSFKVVLMATQENAEMDSFDENYDDIEIPEMDIQTIDGATYGRAQNGDYYLIDVEDETLTEYTVAPGVDILGAGNGRDDLKRIFGKGAPLEKLTLPEGLKKISDNVLNQVTNLREVNIPSTVQSIGIMAFRTTAMESLTIPASVTEIKEGAFRDMPNLRTVTVEGNVAFDKFVFRSCKNLETIYLLGDDVTFAAGQFATYDNTGSGSEGITVYVKNATVASRLIAAQNNLTVKVLGETTDGSDAIEVQKAPNATKLQEILTGSTEDVVISLTGNISGDVTVPQSKNTRITINGGGKTVTGAITVDGKSGTIGSAGLTIENVVFEPKDNPYDACVRLGASGNNNTRYTCNVTIKNCTFIGNGTEGYIGIKSYTGGDKNLVVTDCVATNIHSLMNVKNVDKVVVERCQISGGRGISLGSSLNVKITDTKIDVLKYGIRSESRDKLTTAMVITDCEINASIPVVLRDVDYDYALTFNGTNTITATNAEGLWCVAAANEYEYGKVNKADLTAVTGNVTVTLNDKGLDANGVFVKK